MKYLVLVVLLIFLAFPVCAETLSPDSFIIKYDPETHYETSSESVDTPVKNHMHKDTVPELGTNSIEVKQKKTEIPWILPRMVRYFTEKVTNLYRRFFPLKQNKTVIYQPSIKSVTKSKPKTVPKNGLPKLASPSGGWLSKFQGDPYSQSIPEQVKEVYTWDRLWNPSYNPDHYLQCTTYVAMIYNLHGISLKGKVYGDANTWITFSNIFTVYKSGETTDVPKMMDIVVWAANGANHVGVVVYATETSITITNANSAAQTYSYRLIKDQNDITSITNSEGKTAAEAWVPSHWLRIK